MSFKLRDYQTECIDIMMNTKGGERKLISLPTGCHEKGTKILMHDGTLKNVEDVMVGDQLMGDDSTPRNVLELHRGTDEMYKIIPKKGDSFVVNKGHILSLKTTSQGGKYPSQQKGIVNNISVSDYLNKSKTYKHINKLYRTPVSFSKKDLPIDPYFLGLILGDGSMINGKLNICTPDHEIVNEIHKFANIYKLSVRKEIQPNNKSSVFHLINGERERHKNGKNYVIKELKKLNIYNKRSGDKFIPHIYKVSNSEDRLFLLAGLLDTDGYLHNNGFEYCTKSEKLKDDTLFLARSLGLAVYSSEKKVNYTTYYRISISGNTDMIPTKVIRKQASKRRQSKDVLMTGFDCEYVGVGNYYGFTVDGNNLYVMGDFTVTHNSGKTVVFSTYASKVRGRTLIVVPSTELREQSIEKLQKIAPDIDVGSVQGSINEVSNQIIVATRQSLTHKKSKRMDEMLKHGHFDSVIFDEVHQACKQVVKIINKIKDNNIKVFGVTATPYNRELNKIFKQIDYQKPLLDMILEGYLCEPKAIMVDSTTSLIGIKTVAGEFNQKELEETVDNPLRNRLIVESYKEFAKDRKATLVFCVGIDHLKHVVDEFRSDGIQAEGLDSTNTKEERQTILERFKQNKIPVLVNCGVLTTGFDYEALDCIILARPTKSKILYTQIIGRGLRKHPDKKDCLIIDINDVVKSHDLLNMSNIFDMPMKHGETPSKAIKRIKKEKEEEEKRKQEEELRQKERERLKQEQMRIEAQKIKLLNRDMKARMDERKLDWWRVDNLTYALSYAIEVHYVIENVNDEYIVYNVVTSKNDKRAEEICKHDNLNSAIKYVESKVNRNAFTLKNSDWKTDPATEGQRKYCSWARTKWDAACYFTGNNIKSALKKYKKETSMIKNA